MPKSVLVLFFCLVLSGCKRYDLTVTQQIINQEYLASSHVGTPDPRQACPPYGRRLIISWQIPREILNKHPKIELDIIYWDYTEGHLTYEVSERKGYVLYSLLNREFVEKKGLLSYRAKMVTEEGKVYRSWKQQLWVDLIHVKEEGYTPPPQPQFPK